MLSKDDVISTETKLIEGIKHTTHYVNRPIRQGDPQGGSFGSTINGVEKIIEIIKYEYKSNIK